MATPRNVGYKVASGTTGYFGEAAPNLLPAWMGASGQWSSLPNSVFTGNPAGWTGTPPGGYSNYVAMVFAWGGGVLNTVGVKPVGGTFVPGTFLIVWGGGHHDYAGNEVYAYGPLENNVPGWVRLTNPTIPVQTNVDHYADGNPTSRHTYDQIHYLPDTNEMICLGVGGKYDTGYAGLSIDIFNFNTNTWAFVDYLRDPSGAPGGIGTAWNTVVGGRNPVTKKIWIAGCTNSSTLQCFDEASRTMLQSRAYNDVVHAYNSKGCIDPVGNLLLMPNTAGQPLYVDLSNPATSPSPLTTTGTGPVGSAWEYDWDTVNNRLVCWDNAGTALYTLTPPSGDRITNQWVWGALPGGSGANPMSVVSALGTVQGNGIYGRFRMVPSLRGALVLPNENAPMYFYRF